MCDMTMLFQTLSTHPYQLSPCICMPSTPFTTGHYFCTSDLLAIAACENPSPSLLPPTLCNITTPLNLSAWQTALTSHPDCSYSAYILDGRFHIGFVYTAITWIISASSKHPSANEHPDVISNALHQEVVKGQLVGPLIPKQYPYIQISSLGAVPKKHSVDKWRLILDVSHPKGSSINDGINCRLCSLSYVKVDDVVQHVLSLRRGGLLACRAVSLSTGGCLQYN